MPELEIGSLQQRITIESATDVVGTRGGITQTWTIFSTRWAKIEPLIGTERFVSQQVAPNLSHRVTMRHLAGVTPKMRITFGSRHFDIQAVMNLEESNKFIVMLCEERLN